MAKIVHAALEGYGTYKDKGYFFNGDQYTRYDWKKDRANDGYPLFNTAWNLSIPFLNGFDAAINGQASFKGKAYFFKDNLYTRYDWATDRVDNNYPKDLSVWNFPSGFASGIDAALNGVGRYAGKAYFFKGGQYIRYDWATDKPDAGYPLPLTSWDLPAPFSSGIDAAINGVESFAGKAYFFKDEHYARYNWQTDKVEAVNPIAGNWPLLAELTKAGIARTMVFKWLLTTQPQIKAYILHLMTGAPFVFDINLFNAALNTHFHIASSMPVAQKLANLQIIDSNYDKLFAVLKDTAQVFRGRVQTEAVSDGGVDALGVAYPAYTFFNQSINFTSSFEKFGPLCQAAMVLHEPVHYIDNKADAANDYYEHSPQYATITVDKAVHNPSSYVCFAQHLYYGFDERYGAGRPLE